MMRAALIGAAAILAQRAIGGKVAPMLVGVGVPATASTFVADMLVGVAAAVVVSKVV